MSGVSIAGFEGLSHCTLAVIADNVLRIVAVVGHILHRPQQAQLAAAAAQGRWNELQNVEVGQRTALALDSSIS